MASSGSSAQTASTRKSPRSHVKNADSAPVAPEEDKLRLPHTSSTTSSLSSHTGSLSSPSPSLFATGSTPTNSYSPASTPSSPYKSKRSIPRKLPSSNTSDHKPASSASHNDGARPSTSTLIFTSSSPMAFTIAPINPSLEKLGASLTKRSPPSSPTSLYPLWNSLKNKATYPRKVRSSTTPSPTHYSKNSIASTWLPRHP